jgi:hypothetical protein
LLSPSSSSSSSLSSSESSSSSFSSSRTSSSSSWILSPAVRYLFLALACSCLDLTSLSTFPISSTKAPSLFDISVHSSPRMTAIFLFLYKKHSQKIAWLKHVFLQPNLNEYAKKKQLPVIVFPTNLGMIYTQV